MFKKRFKDRTNECRIVITTECNINCYYCINQFYDVKKRFVFERMQDVVNYKFGVYNISGGEPFIEFDKLCKLCTLIRKLNPDSKISVYTNGYSDKIIDDIDLYFIGLHKWFYYECLERIIQLRYYFPSKYIELIVERETYKKNEMEINKYCKYYNNLFVWEYHKNFDYSKVRPNEKFFIV